MANFEQWNGFKGSIWKEEVNVRDFIQNNYTPYDGDEAFLAGPTEATDKLWGALQKLQKQERAQGGVLDMDNSIVSSITSHQPGYIDEGMKDLEQVVGLQTDKPLKRAFMPFGGIKMAEGSLTENGYEVNPELHKIFTEYHLTHSDAVFQAYTPEMPPARATSSPACRTPTAAAASWATIAAWPCTASTTWSVRSRRTSPTAATAP